MLCLKKNTRTYKMKTPRIIAIVIGLFILFVISIPFIEELGRNKIERKVYPELRQDTLKSIK